jgi:hypothetical protein
MMLSYKGVGDGEGARASGAPAPFITEPQRAIRAIVVGLVLGAVLAALARRS